MNDVKSIFDNTLELVNKCGKILKDSVIMEKETDVFRYYSFINAENEEEYNYYINESRKASLYDTGKTAEYGDQLLTLSTCTYHVEDGRFVVVQRKSDKLLKGEN